MNIVVITSEPLREIPPVLTLIQVLSSQRDYNVTCITFSKEKILENYERVKNLYIREQPINFVEKHHNSRIEASIAFRAEKIIKALCAHRIPRVFRNKIAAADVVWIAHENVFRFGGNYFLKHIPPYIFTMYELQFGNKNDRKIFKKAAEKASILVSPEYCRAHIMKAIYSRKELPSIIPNKPLEHPRHRNLPITDDRIRDCIDKIEKSNRKIIMYMGILSNERPLEPIIEAVETVRDQYEFVVLGEETKYLKQLIKHYDSFTYLGSVTPPQHLEIASHAHIAYVSYIPQNHSINAVFCAPNKVYEFAGFGIPMLCNDVPGLKFTVEEAEMGVCILTLDRNSILDAIDRIEVNKNEMEIAATAYYDQENLPKAINSTIEQYLKTK